MDNGADLYRRFREGEQEAFTEIVEQYGHHLIFFINGFVGNITVSEDLMEETFCHLIFRKPKFNELSSFKTYLFSIAKNKAFEYRRKAARDVYSPLENHGEREDEKQLEDIVIKSEQNKQLYSAIRKIGGEYAAVIHLLYFEDMSYKSAGKVLGKSEKQISNLAYRAKQALKKIMEKENFNYEDY
ncbi:MAG: sigma-70 family RNA polymerase sigma factor [Oscillospiraceae bacterium]|jgi:RNA polymerase sigma-70 factor (ECF subfamily)|nr:sigma-70 family RNA polymerase sigma factor [Oscillospiraceae bacterium]